jgi:hypothetical protein
MLTHLTSPLLAGVCHGFLGRTGGRSTGIFASLNVGLGSRDDRAAVAWNRALARDAVAPGTRLVTVHQVHGTRCLVAGDWGDDARPEADALATREPGLALGVLTADCAPVLFADRQQGVVAAAHAGWKGALAGVLEATLDTMEALGAARSRVAAVIGPCIAPESYEVGAEFRDRFLASDAEADRFFRPGPRGRPHFDLPGYAAERLRRAGAGAVAALGIDTLGDSERFFSYRRTTLAGEPDYGRQLSLVALP